MSNVVPRVLGRCERVKGSPLTDRGHLDSGGPGYSGCPHRLEGCRVEGATRDRGGEPLILTTEYGGDGGWLTGAGLCAHPFSCLRASPVATRGWLEPQRRRVPPLGAGKGQRCGSSRDLLPSHLWHLQPAGTGLGAGPWQDACVQKVERSLLAPFSSSTRLLVLSDENKLPLASPRAAPQPTGSLSTFG